MIDTYDRDRYIWGYRTELARSVHDMTKQMYDSKKYSPVAWKPLREWLLDGPEDTYDERQRTLVKFNKKSKEFIHVVAKCLWRMAGGPNLPWGRGAVQPVVFSAIPHHEKVVAG